MSAHTFVAVNGRYFLSTREDYLPDVAALFSEDELETDGGQFHYATSVRSMKDRLQIEGFTQQRSRESLDSGVEVWLERSPNPFADELGVPTVGTVDILASLATYIHSEDHWARWEEPEVFSQLQAREVLRLIVDACDDDSVTVQYELIDLRRYELLVPGTPITNQSRQDRNRALADDAPLVILTEGSSDSIALTEAIKVTHPHLVGFLRFMDFSSDAEGSVNGLVKTFRSFIGAGIANRVIVLADNDTAAHDVLDRIRRDNLPAGYRILHYPDLEMLKTYPTLGPYGKDPVLTDVNGKAGALEMYLGRDLLEVNGNLSPVQWKAYNEGAKQYQGVLSPPDKKRVQTSFKSKTAQALRDPLLRHDQDWTGIEQIIQTILGAFD